MNVPIVQPNVDLYVDKILSEMQISLRNNDLTNVNKHVEAFEIKLSEYIGVKHVVAVSSGTLGLVLAIKALGIRGKEIIIPSFTFVATAAAISWTNNYPIYVDIDQTWTINPADLETKITKNTGAIIGVHLYGNPCNIDVLVDLAASLKIPLLFDAAHALGSRSNDRKVGQFGLAEVFSLSPSKVLTTGEGGLITTNNDNFAEKVRNLRNYGLKGLYESDTPGLNARMSELHAILGIAQLPDLDKFISNRQRYAHVYKKDLSNLSEISFQEIKAEDVSTYKNFPIVINPQISNLDRNKLAHYLLSKNIHTKTYYFPPLHQISGLPPVF